jgi:hypothetical protein
MCPVVQAHEVVAPNVTRCDGRVPKSWYAMLIRCGTQTETDVVYGGPLQQGKPSCGFGALVVITQRCMEAWCLADTVQIRWIIRAVNVRQPIVALVF